MQKPLRCARLQIYFFFIGSLGCFCEHRLASCSRILNLLFSQSSSRLPIKALTSRVLFIIGSRCKINRLNTRSRSEHSFWFNRQTSFVKRSTHAILFLNRWAVGFISALVRKLDLAWLRMKWEQTRNLLTTNGEPLKENWTRFENNTHKNKNIPKTEKVFKTQRRCEKSRQTFFPDNPHSFKMLMHNRRAKIVWLFAIRCPRSRLTYRKFSNSQLLLKILDFIKTVYMKLWRIIEKILLEQPQRT